jgi:hypothetical protein
VSTDGNQTGPVDEMGPIDFLVVEFPGARFAGEGLPLLVGLADRGVIRVLDLAFIKKGPDAALLDLTLPRTSGFRPLQLLLRDGGGPRRPGAGADGAQPHGGAGGRRGRGRAAGETLTRRGTVAQPGAPPGSRGA